MKFKIYTTEDNYINLDIHRISKHMDWLTKIGFKFKEKGSFLEIQKPIDIDINSLEDLLEISKFCSIIVHGKTNELEIYDGHHS